MADGERRYVALVRLLIPNGPGKVPGTVRVAPGEVFSLDGDEGVRIDLLLANGQVREYIERPKRAPKGGNP